MTYSNQTTANLTIESLLAVVKQFREKFTIWYGTQEGLERGKFLHCKATDYTPEFIVCHPDDLETLKQATPGFTWRHLREYVPEQSWIMPYEPEHTDDWRVRSIWGFGVSR